MERNKVASVKKRNKVFTTSQGVEVKEFGKPNIQLLARKLIEVQFKY